MSKTVRLSETMIKRLEDFRKVKIERAKILSSSCPSYLSDIKYYEEIDLVDLLDDCILSGLVDMEVSLKNLSACFKD